MYKSQSKNVCNMKNQDSTSPPKSTNFKIMIPTKCDFNEMPDMESSKMMLNTFK